ncbi:DUF2207 domain-containing protein [Arenibacter sp. F20364]|uniref:DUF2207 domain-containing protein n=1 Tax=Arenibacter sp. F20364 TaxID=2926415 RepID=UPI001FF30533|nr:DUF2207 domain-containing protein [Arenibacter sp. F20364]MCK0189229.1 DUF2207 domain-containing protein [Arenibacter sp. F20364]
MKNSYYFFLFFLTINMCWAQDFTVKNYTVDITVHPEGYFDVVENYDLNFEIPKHGIYRIIQTEYDLVDSKGAEATRKIRISKIKVPDYKFEAPFDFVQKLQDNLEIKIGDKDITLVGPQHYEIKYRVHNALLFEDSQIRFYWNIKPEDWLADFHQISFTIKLPENIYPSKENSFVYSGDRGTATTTTDMQFYYTDNEFSGTSKSGFISHPGQSVTVLINLPPGSVKEEKPFWPFWDKYGWVFLIGIMLTAFSRIWWKFGRDKRVIATTSYYPPDKIDPAMVGFLINDREDNSDLIALIPYWGSKGLIRLEEMSKKGLFGSKDTKIIRLQALPVDSPSYELEIFRGLFGDNNNVVGTEVLVSSLKDTFYTKMIKARSQLKESAQPYYEAESKKMQGIMYVALIALAIGLTLGGLFFWGPLAAVAIVGFCILLIFVNRFMVKKNAKGNELLSELKGFKRFIKVAEENRLKMLLKDDPHYFENTLGYALAFGLFDQWAKKFRDLNIPPPDWYTSTSSSSLTMNQFSKSFSNAMASTKSNMVSSPSSSSSSGGGSSGGGFGGGGGGSW